MNLLLIATLLVGIARAEAPTAQISSLIEQLDDADFAHREAAVAALEKLGRPAIDPLAKAAAGSSPEVTSRAVGVLERLMDSDDPQTIDAADAALVALLDSQDAQATSLAQMALSRKALVREQRAIARIKELGGQVQMGPSVTSLGQPLPGLSFEQAREVRPRKFLIGKDWKGGVEGLDQFRKLAHINFLTIYVEDGCGVPFDQVQSLASVLPGLLVHQRGPLVGIECETTAETDCIVRRATAGGPAEKAGLQPGDRVVAIEDQPVRKFQDLVDSLMKYKAGDTVTLSIERRGEVLGIDVTLEAWTLPPVDDTAPLP